MDTEIPRMSADESKMESAKASGEIATLSPLNPMEVVDFEGEDDPYNAQNWPMKKKMRVFALYSLMTASATFASTMFVPLPSMLDVKPLTFASAIILVSSRSNDVSMSTAPRPWRACLCTSSAMPLVL